MNDEDGEKSEKRINVDARRRKKLSVKEGDGARPNAVFYAFAFFPFFFFFIFLPPFAAADSRRGGLAKLINVNLLT